MYVMPIKGRAKWKRNPFNLCKISG